MTVVVTGASGFVGGAVVRRLAALGVDTVALSRRPLRGFVHVDDYGDAPRGDALIHLAEANSRRRMEAGGAPYEDEASVALTSLMRGGYTRVVYASSALLYGDAQRTPRRPSDPIHATDGYTRMKQRSELAILDHPGGVVARLTNLYGRGMSSDNVVSAILTQVPGRGPLTIMDATPVRDFLDVEDAAAALAVMATADARGVYNVGSGVGTSIGDLAREVLRISGESGRPVVSTQKSSRQSSLVLDIADTTAAFEWRPETGLGDGLSKLLTERRDGR